MIHLPNPIDATITLAQATSHKWDALVIGAGIAGTATAIRLTMAGMEVLLVDAKAFPRAKVCGGCLNAKSLKQLDALGIRDAMDLTGAPAVTEIRMMCGSHEARWPMPPTRAISRETLDAILIRRAIELGVQFLSETTAHVEAPANGQEVGQTGIELTKSRRVKLKTRSGGAEVAKAHVVICADGLGHPSLRLLPEFRCHVRHDSRIGIQATFAEDELVDAFPERLLTMVAGPSGYVGITRVEQSQLNMAAAINPKKLAHERRPEHLVRELLSRCRLPLPQSLSSATWTGTPPLTQQSGRVAGYRLFLVGDATGYIEPFTGEGMAWALAASEAVVPLACSARVEWSSSLAEQWPRVLKERIVKHQWICRLLAGLLRYPMLAGMTLELCRRMPSLPRKAMQSISGERPPSPTISTSMP